MSAYTTERRRAARLLVSPERRQEISRLGGLRRMATASPEEKTAMALAGAASRRITQSPERRSEIARIGARAANAARSKAQHSQKVLEFYGFAECIGGVINPPSERYIIAVGWMVVGKGKTKAQAWVDAARRLRRGKR